MKQKEIKGNRREGHKKKQEGIEGNKRKYKEIERNNRKWRQKEIQRNIMK